MKLSPSKNTLALRLSIQSVTSFFIAFKLDVCSLCAQETMIVDLYPFTKVPAKVVLERRGDFAAFYQVVVENSYAPLLKEIRRGDVVIDAGANIGIFSILASFRVGEEGKVIAIEPESRNLELLRRNLELNKIDNVVVVPKALYDVPGKRVRMEGSEAMTYVSEEGGGDVETTTLDEIVDSLKLKPRVLKMDIEGSEGKALIGGANALRTIEHIEMEVHDEENMKKVSEILAGFEREYLKVEDLSSVLKSAIRHPFLVFRIEYENHFSTTKRVISSRLIKSKKDNNAKQSNNFPVLVLFRKVKMESRPLER